MTGRATSMQRAAAETPSMEATRTMIAELRTDVQILTEHVETLTGRVAEALAVEPARPVMTEQQVREALAPMTMAARKIAASAGNLARASDGHTRTVARSIGVAFAIPTVAACGLLAWAIFLR